MPERPHQANATENPTFTVPEALQLKLLCLSPQQHCTISPEPFQFSIFPARLGQVHMYHPKSGKSNMESHGCEAGDRQACCFLNDRNQDERIKGPTNGLGLCNARCSVCQPQAAGTHGTCFHGPTTQAWRERQSRTCDDHAVKFASADATRPRIRTEIEWRERRAVRCSWRMSA
jgi:hypothetical protein